MVDFAVVPERTALVNVDMQNCFVEGAPISAPDGLAVLDLGNDLPMSIEFATGAPSDEVRPSGQRQLTYVELLP